MLVTAQLSGQIVPKEPEKIHFSVGTYSPNHLCQLCGAACMSPDKQHPGPTALGACHTAYSLLVKLIVLSTSCTGGPKTQERKTDFRKGCVLPSSVGINYEIPKMTPPLIRQHTGQERGKHLKCHFA